MRNRGRTGLAVVACAMAWAAAACGPTSPEPRVLRGPDGLLVVATGSTSGGMDALISGELVRGEGGCLSVETPDGVVLLVFPRGTELVDDDGPPGVAVPGQGTYRLGDDVELGGGEVQPNAGAKQRFVPTGCVADVAWVVAP